MDQLQHVEEANWQWMSIANATPLPGSLQPSTTPGVMSVFFNHLHCRTSTMAQVPTLVAKPLFNAMQLPLSNMKTLFWSCCNYLKQLSPPYASKRCQDHTANNCCLWAGYGESVELLFQSLLLTHRARWTIIIVHCNNGDCVLSWSRHGCLPPLVLVLQIISSATVKEHKQASVVSASVPCYWAHAKQKEIESGR